MSTNDTNHAPTATDLPAWFQEHLAALDRRRQQVLKQAHFAAVVDDAMKAFDDLMPSAIPYDDDITLSLWVKDMKRVVELIRHLRAAGFKVQSHKDVPDDKLRIYSLRRDDGARIGLFARASYEAQARCRWVQVGTKEVPVMHLQCDGDEAQP